MHAKAAFQRMADTMHLFGKTGVFVVDLSAWRHVYACSNINLRQIYCIYH